MLQKQKQETLAWCPGHHSPPSWPEQQANKAVDTPSYVVLVWFRTNSNHFYSKKTEPRRKQLSAFNISNCITMTNPKPCWETSSYKQIVALTFRLNQACNLNDDKGMVQAQTLAPSWCQDLPTRRWLAQPWYSEGDWETRHSSVQRLIQQNTSPKTHNSRRKIPGFKGQQNPPGAGGSLAKFSNKR